MLAICIEASHQRGMGHLFRAVNFISFLKEKNEAFIVLVNDDEASLNILRNEKIPFETVDYKDESGNWERAVFEKYRPDIWLNDKFESSYGLCSNIKKLGIPLALIDDRGAGSGLCDIHFAGMIFGDDIKEIKGAHILKGLKYSILNPEISKYKRHRDCIKKIIITLGGSDTYGATVLAAKLIKEKGKKADIVLGANFKHDRELAQVIDDSFRIFRTVPSLMEKFYEYDLAITGGGVTPIEANGAGLPCIIIANEIHEIATGKYLESQGGSVFAGYYKDIDPGMFETDSLNIGIMSKKAIENIPLNGAENIYNELMRLVKE